MGRPCILCSDAGKAAEAQRLLTAGASIREVGKALGTSHVAVMRHRDRHLAARSKATLQSAQQRLVDAEAEIGAARQHLVEAEADEAALEQFLSKAGITRDLVSVRDRLERVGAAAEQGGQQMAAVAASNVQLRAAEVRAKIGGVGGYAPPRAVASDAPKFELNIIFSGGHTQHIVGTPMASDDPAFDAIPAVPLSIGADHSTGGNAPGGAENQDDEDAFDEDV